MTANPLLQAVDRALAAHDHLGTLFNKIGNIDHPRGVIPTAYRNARRALRSALRERSRTAAAGEVLDQLQGTVRTGLTPIFTGAEQYGQDNALRQLNAYGLRQTAPTEGLGSQAHSAIDGTLAVIHQQHRTALAMIALDLDPALILGDDERVGVLRPGDAIAAAAFWTATMLWSGFEKVITAQLDRDPGMPQDIHKLAVAAVDSRTTGCCLKVHGQVQPFYQPFHLTGTPRYADRLDWSPFHPYCRTSIALYLREFDDGITQGMHEAASAQLARRVP